jgi:nitroreductase
MGLQPWHFFVIEDQGLRNQLLEYSYKQTKVANAGHLIVLASKTTITDADIDHFIDFTAKER